MTAYGAPITTSDTYYGEREHRWLAMTLLGQKMVPPPTPPAWAGDPSQCTRLGTYPAGQHAQGPLVQVHDGVVLPLVVVDLLGPE